MKNTQKLGLPLYEANDPADLIAGYNSAMNKLDGGSIVWIGDSWTDGWITSTNDHTKAFPYLVSQKMGMTERRYAESGGGWVQTGNNNKTFTDLVNSAISDASYDHSETKYVIVLGGINDTRNFKNVGKAYNSAKSAFSLLANEFTKARIMFIGLNEKAYNQNFTEQMYMEFMQKAVESINGECYADLGRCFMGDGMYALTNADGLHPNDYGHERIARYILSKLLGFDAYRQIRGYADISTLVSSASSIISSSDPCFIEMTIDGNVVSIHFEFKTTGSGLASGTTLFKGVPSQTPCPSSYISGKMVTPIPVYSNNSTMVGRMEAWNNTWLYFGNAIPAGTSVFAYGTYSFDNFIRLGARVSEMTFDSATYSVAMGSTLTITPVFTPAAPNDKNVLFESSNPAVCTVNSSTGEVTPVAVGTCTITGTSDDGGYIATASVTVTAA